ncbi:MAG: hypothetical protein K0S80_1093, partial [Neobacillus sp.]|nr:hypothetical protein [Neobacillus sp.]
AMGFTGKKAMQWKMKYIAAFNQMEQKLATLDQPSVSVKPLKSVPNFGESISMNQSISVNALNCALTQIFYM